MDAIVEKALAKWPNVPHCHGWLALDARGYWRMRDESVQRLEQAGERITSPALIAFIQRNYLQDEQGGWYFQNGPQRVYVDLEVTPFIVRTDPQHGFMLHTGHAMQDMYQVWLSDQGRMLFQHAQGIALLDDRDLENEIDRLYVQDTSATDTQLMEWIDSQGQSTLLEWVEEVEGVDQAEEKQKLSVSFIAESALEKQFGFIKRPR